jgi:hypothetical protein
LNMRQACYMCWMWAALHEFYHNNLHNLYHNSKFI